MPHQYDAVGPGIEARARQGYRQGRRELGDLLQQAVRLVENTELRAANETLKEATMIFAGLQNGGWQNPR